MESGGYRTVALWGCGEGVKGFRFRDIIPTVKNEMEKKIENKIGYMTTVAYREQGFQE